MRNKKIDAARIISEVAASVKVIDLFDSEPLPDKHGQGLSHCRPFAGT